MTSDSACNLIQEAANNALNIYGDMTGQTKIYVATFGNSAVEKTGDWVPILVVGPPGAVSKINILY